MKILLSSYLQKPAKVCFDGEDADENVVLFLRPHFITNLVWIVLSIFMFAVPTILTNLFSANDITVLESFPPEYKFMIGAFWAIFTFGFIFTSFLRWFFNASLVTNKRIIDIDFESLIHRRFSEAFLFNIEDLTHQISGALQVIFNYGTLHMQTAGELRELDFDYIPHPAKAQDVISDLAANLKRENRHND